jgi:hypothetical protein
MSAIRSRGKSRFTMRDNAPVFGPEAEWTVHKGKPPSWILALFFLFPVPQSALPLPHSGKSNRMEAQNVNAPAGRGGTAPTQCAQRVLEERAVKTVNLRRLEN